MGTGGRGGVVDDFRPMEALLLQSCLIWGVIATMLGALIALWARRNKG